MAAIAVGAVGVLAVTVVSGVAWYFSGVAISVADGGPATTSVRAGAGGNGGQDGTARLDTAGVGGESAEARGLHGVSWAGGWGIVGEVRSESDDSITRSWQDVVGELPEEPVDGVVFQEVYDGDPGGRGLTFTEVVVTSDVGDLPTWLVPADGSPSADASNLGPDWVIFIHGRGGSRREFLRYLPVFHELGWTALVPSYRNDAGAPPDPSGGYRLGESEWRDIDASLAYARANGAERVVLAGWSMGGAIAMQTLDRSADADLVAGLVLNAPVLDWRDTFRHQGSLAGLPGWWTDVAVVLVERRARVDLDDYDWVARADELDLPIYLVHSEDDEFVPSDPSVALAGARPDIVTFRPDGPADHTREWNVDPDGYDADLRSWFETTLPLPPPP